MTKRRVALLAATVLAIVAADQYTKSLVIASLNLGESRAVIDNVFWLTRVKNTGAAFGMLKGQTWFLIAVAVVVLASVAYVAVKVRPRAALAQFAMAMISAGASGNLIDRLFSGGVTDFFDVGWWPVFNVADISLDVGMALLVWWLLFGKEHVHPAGAEDVSSDAPEATRGPETGGSLADE